MSASLKVKLFDSGGTQVIPVPKSNLTIGSAKHCDVVLEHASVQEEHLRAWFDGGRVWIQDMGSSNGTFLNGIRLPSLKPMLVRELDVLKLGENPATLGLEANMVRAPVVRPSAPADEVTSPGVKAAAVKDAELEKKRDELAKIRRELAELKLQLQMGRLDKESEDEAHRQLSMMRNEVNALSEQKAKIERAMKQMEQQRQSQLKAVENEISERKTSAMNQLKNLMDHEMSKLADWKMQVMAELRRDLHAISQAKAKAWITRPLSNDMILEWESDIQGLLRRVLLGEKSEPAALSLDTPPPTQSSALKRVKERHRERDRKEESTGRTAVTVAERTAMTPVPRLRRKASAVSARDGFKFLLAALLVGGLIAAAVALKTGFIPIKERAVAGSSESSGSSVQSPRVRRKFEPPMTKTFKKTYTDNTLYTSGFIDSELNSGYRTQWLVDLNKAALGEWKIDLATAKVIADKELMMLQDLKRLRETVDGANEQPGIQAMRERESYFQKELETLLKSRASVDKFNRLKKSFFSRVQSKKQ